jgi:AcrR family transcriptional regulator
MTLFARDGFDGVSIRQLSAAVGVTLATLYHYFPDKQTLYDDAVHEAFAYMTRRMVAATESDQHGEARLRSFLHALVSLQVSDAVEVRLVDRELLEARPETLARLGGQLFQRPPEALAEILLELAPQAPAKDIAEHVIASAYGAVKLRAVRLHVKGMAHLCELDGIVESLNQMTMAVLRGF